MTPAGGENNEKYNWRKCAFMWTQMHVKKFKERIVIHMNILAWFYCF